VPINNINPAATPAGQANKTNAKHTGSINRFHDILVDEYDNGMLNGYNRVDNIRYPYPADSNIIAGLLDGENSIAYALNILASLSEQKLSSISGMMLLRVHAALSNLSGQDIETVRKNIMNVGALPKSNATHTGMLKETSGQSIPYEAWKSVNPAIISTVYNRNPVLYRRVIDQFSVETNPRYEVNKNGRNDTYCNIFMWDVTRAMGAEIPHYIDPDTKTPMYYPDVKGARQLTANGIYDWLHECGGNYGWYEVGPKQAQALANQGRPAVAALRNNSGGHGHVQVVCPSRDGKYDASRGVTIAQAGRNLTSYTPITSIYRKSLPRVSYFAHI